MKKFCNWLCQIIQKTFNWIYRVVSEFCYWVSGLIIFKLALVLIGIPLAYKNFGPWSTHITILMIVIFVVLAFNCEISNFLNRLIKLSAYGVAAEAYNGKLGSNDSSSSYNLTQEVYPPEDSYISPVVFEEKKIIWKQLSESNMTLDSQYKRLIQDLAHKNVFLHYYWINHYIVTEQQEFLRKLNGVEYLDQSEVQEQFNNFLRRTKYENVTVDRFMPWLIEQHLVLEQEQGKYFITNKGRDYLKFLISIGHSAMSSNKIS